MKPVSSTFFFILTITVIKCAKIDIEIASVLNKVNTIDFDSIDSAILGTIPSEAFVWLSFYDHNCVEQKLNLKNVDKSQIYDIKNLTEFENLNLNNKKIFIVIENAAKLCTRSSKKFKDEGINHVLTVRAFMVKFIFPDARLNPERATECFRWALSKVEPNSHFIDNFDSSSLNYTIAACEESTSIEDYKKQIEKEMKELEIRSCDVDTYGQPRGVGYNIMKMFLSSKLSEKIEQYREELTEEVIKFEADLLETQNECILRDLRDEK